MKSEYLKYHNYLKNRSVFGFFYRNFFLYPILNKNLKGLTLDFGCGLGSFLRFRCDTVGVDINPLNIDFCNKKSLKAFLFNNNLPFSPAFFDSILIDNVLEHIECPHKVMLSLTKVLKKNGFLLIGVPGVCGYYSDSDHKIFYDQASLKSLVLPFGYKFKKSFYLPFRSNFLNKRMKQYCLYMQFVKNH
jgi:SAM-dependent methyltransferase